MVALLASLMSWKRAHFLMYRTKGLTLQSAKNIESISQMVQMTSIVLTAWIFFLEFFKQTKKIPSMQIGQDYWFYQILLFKWLVHCMYLIIYINEIHIYLNINYTLSFQCPRYMCFNKYGYLPVHLYQ